MGSHVQGVLGSTWHSVLINISRNFLFFQTGGVFDSSGVPSAGYRLLFRTVRRMSSSSFMQIDAAIGRGRPTPSISPGGRGGAVPWSELPLVAAPRLGAATRPPREDAGVRPHTGSIGFGINIPLPSLFGCLRPDHPARPRPVSTCRFESRPPEAHLPPPIFPGGPNRRRRG